MVSYFGVCTIVFTIMKYNVYFCWLLSFSFPMLTDLLINVALRSSVNNPTIINGLHDPKG